VTGSPHRVLFITGVDFAKPSGAQMATSQVLSALHGQPDVELRAVAVRSGAIRHSPLSSSVDVRWIEGRGPAVVRAVTQSIRIRREVRRALREFKPTIAVVRQGPLLLPAVAAVRAAGIPIILLARGLMPWGDTGRLTDRVARRALMRLNESNFRTADRVYAAFEEVAAWAGRVRGSRAGVRIVPHAVSEASFTSQPSETRQAVRRELGISDDAFVVGFVGGLQARHRIDVLLEAVAALAVRANSADPHVLLVGEGPQGVALRQRAESLGIASRVSMTGFIDHSRVARFIVACDLLYGVVSEKEPSNPIKCYEYLACDRMLLGSTRPEFGFVSRLGCGELVRHVDASNVAAAIERVMQLDSSERGRRASLGGEYVRKHHTWGAMARLILDDAAGLK
jgi:glycosyltransferase involved in cell wall biosynthesis